MTVTPLRDCPVHVDGEGIGKEDETFSRHKKIHTHNHNRAQSLLPRHTQVLRDDAPSLGRARENVIVVLVQIQ